jgi:IMP dehydrogenase
MAKILDDVSRTFQEYLLIPQLTEKKHAPSNVSLKTPLGRHPKGADAFPYLNIPFVSAAMQAVSGEAMAVSLARNGGLAFIYGSQPVGAQADMVRRVKAHKAGFVQSDSNLKPTDPLARAIELTKRTRHSTMPVTADGTSNGELLGILTDKDYWEFEDDMQAPVSQFMTPRARVIHGTVGINLHEANRLLRQHKKECLPILDDQGRLHSLVFKKDYLDHRNNPYELLDDQKRLMVGAAVNTHDYRDRVPALIDAGVDALVFDSSDGYAEYQKEAALWTRKAYGTRVVIGGGNIVDREAFRYLVDEAQVDFVKVGIGGGSICITRLQKGIGRGQASALVEVARERDRYFEEKGLYIPVCSDGGLANDTQIIIALAMGADFVMMGRYFAQTNESPSPRVSINGRVYKPYWGEGSNRARNWQRYSHEAEAGQLKFEEGIDGYVPIAGGVKEVLEVTLAKLKSTMCNCGGLTLNEFYRKAVLTRISEQSYVEGGTSNILSLDKDVPEQM